MPTERAIVIGAGPAGLTAAYELLSRAGIQPVVLEKSAHLGGISRTANYKGYRIDLGGHRFFSRSSRVVNWWLHMLPLDPSGTGAAGEDRVMLLRPRKSRIYYSRQLFDYPLTLSKDTLMKLGPWKTCKIGASYLNSRCFPVNGERNLEQFLINRFGKELYSTFFRSYTEKVWGVPCDRISAEWGAQRIKGLSLWETLAPAFRKALGNGGNGGKERIHTETSLIDRFLYPKFGPGQMWEEVAGHVRRMGGEIRTRYRVDGIATSGWRVQSVVATNLDTGEREKFEGDYFFSTAPVRELMRAFDTPPPAHVLEVSDHLAYRDFIIVGLLVNALRIHDDTPESRQLISDNWIYVQEPDVLAGRLQIFNNWSPFLVPNPAHIWLGLEYFCNQSDRIWSMADEDVAAVAREELSRIGIIDADQVLDSTVLRVEKAYPAYFGAYNRFAEVREYVDRYENLFLVGRNGMHRYNNQDHSMLTAMVAVDHILSGDAGKRAVWEVNPEADGHAVQKTSR